MSAFAFSFHGDDIEDAPVTTSQPFPPSTLSTPNHAAETGSLGRAPSSAFPIAGQPLLKPQTHDLRSMLEALPERISYGTLKVMMDGSARGQVSIPRRELWDVRVQLMAEGDDEGVGALGGSDVKTGVYEGGFKSWESSVDVVKVLGDRRGSLPRPEGGRTILELGCGTALPSLAVFKWYLHTSDWKGGLNLGLADYNPTVLRLVTLPNLLLAWAQNQTQNQHGWEEEGELEINPELIESFLASLKSNNITLSFFSGAWSPEFVELVKETMKFEPGMNDSTIIGAETIYSPAALKSFAETLMGLFPLFPEGEKTALVAAKKVYFGVGGSMEDFCDMVREKGAAVEQIREESDGVRRAVVEVKLRSRPT